MQTIKRFIFLILSAGLYAFPVAAATVSSEDFTAWIITDIHYLADSLHDDGERFRRLMSESDNKNVAMVQPLLDALRWTAASSAAGAGRPDCLIVTGDLTFNGEKASHLELAARFKELERAGIPVYVLPGNHDIDNPMASKFTGATAKPVAAVDRDAFARIYGEYGFDEALSRDPAGLSYLVEAGPGVRLLMLDSTCSGDNAALGYSEAGGRLAEPTRAWIAECAGRAAMDGARLVVAMHHSLVDHNPFINYGYTVDDAESLAEFFSGLGIGYVLTGHTHIQDIARTDPASGPIYDITTGALSVFPHNYGVLSLPPAGSQAGAEYGTRRVDVAGWAVAQGSSETSLLNFDIVAEAYFDAHSASMMERWLESAAVPLDPRLIATLVTINKRFFSGEEYKNELDVVDAAGHSDLDLLPDGFLSEYLRSIVTDRSPAISAWSLYESFYVAAAR